MMKYTYGIASPIFGLASVIAAIKGDWQTFAWTSLVAVLTALWAINEKG